MYYIYNYHNVLYIYTIIIMYYIYNYHNVLYIQLS